jgi:hypothetical protein
MSFLHPRANRCAGNCTSGSRPQERQEEEHTRKQAAIREETQRLLVDPAELFITRERVSLLAPERIQYLSEAGERVGE